MFYIALLLTFIGICCLCAEIFIPGFGVFGAGGIIGLLAAIIITVVYVENGIYIMAAELLVDVGIVYGVFCFVKSKKADTDIILRETLNEDKSDIENLGSFVGKEGVSRTPLKPFGKVIIDDNIYEASSDGDFIGSGESVKVIKIYENKIFVRKI